MMKFKQRPLVLLVVVTQLHLGLCRYRSHDSNSSSNNNNNNNRSSGVSQPSDKAGVTRSPHYPGPKVPGLPISHLMDLSVLDPYNIMSGKSFESKETAALVHQIIPLTSKHIHAFSQNGRAETRRESKDTSNSNSSDFKTKKTKPDLETRMAFKAKKMSRKKTKAQNLPTFHGALEEDWPLTDDAEKPLDYGGLDYTGSFASGSGARKSGRKAHRNNHNVFSKVERGRNVLLHEAVRKLLGFSHTPPAMGKESRYLPDPRRERRLPRYVKDLYKRFQSGEIGAAGLAKGNTVRSIHTSVGEFTI
ncbi:hypothetical protein RRG08_022840 [Elysia crispata]|uniref:Uncharacterized protein n=1 Tax=Elysia crispata TaxID=231223 RepID=A0AAE0Z1U9_9GAST|nr:hypothetical protein RRG08_022840 [Elysia crispata]